MYVISRENMRGTTVSHRGYHEHTLKHFVLFVAAEDIYGSQSIFHGYATDLFEVDDNSATACQDM